ncbi:hypothetical protein ABS755_07230 [Castellaniella sp. FW104-16D08]|uniref:DNA polymerase III subunit beta family protein n=1 Tax=unclassified Castellaniella TaxID=2617606 RepID=UPI0033159636
MSAPVTFNIPLAELQAVALAAGNKDIRPYLNGVAFEFAADGLYLVATDGHRIHVIKATVEEAFGVSGLTGQTLIVPIQPINSLKAPARRKDAKAGIAVSPASTSDKTLWHVSFDLGDSDRTNTTTVHGYTYPDWRRVLPKPAQQRIAIDQPGATVNPQYLADAVKALALLSRERTPAYQYQFVEPNYSHVTGKGDPWASGVYVLGASPAAAQFVAFAMPYAYVVKGQAIVLDLPDWLSPPKAVEDLGDLV